VWVVEVKAEGFFCTKGLYLERFAGRAVRFVLANPAWGQAEELTGAFLGQLVPLVSCPSIAQNCWLKDDGTKTLLVQIFIPYRRLV